MGKSMKVKALATEPFMEAGEEMTNHPLLIAAGRGELPYEKWRDYVMTRLSAGDAFVNFLEALQTSARNEGYTELEAAVAKNLWEELGRGQGTVWQHDTWRTWCREGVRRILSQRGVGTEAVLPDTSSYQETLAELAEEKDPLVMGGALAALEHLIACEYENVKNGALIQFPGLNAEEMVYWRSHAFHDHRHFEEVYPHVKELCTTRKEIERAMRGLHTILEAKVKFLDTVHSTIPR